MRKEKNQIEGGVFEAVSVGGMSHGAGCSQAGAVAAAVDCSCDLT